MNISGFPLLAKLTNLPASSPSTETGQEEISIQENVVSAVIWQRWIACYMLHNWDLLDAESAYVETECIRIQEVCRRLEGATINARSLEGTLTDTFNHVLLEDVEYSIQRYMEAWKCDRSKVEFWIAWVIAELFPVRPLIGK